VIIDIFSLSYAISLIDQLKMAKTKTGEQKKVLGDIRKVGAEQKWVNSVSR
jgi:hypothetical protein